jgi:opacity protein-like surface antigen
LVGHEGLGRLRRVQLRNQEHLARHHARPHRLRLGSLHALHHRRPRHGNLKASSLLGSTSDTRVGWTVGAGAEFALTGNWTAKLEYLYADLGDFDCGGACTLTPPANVDFHTNIVRAGLNYRF